MTLITHERLERMFIILTTDKTAKPSGIKMSEEAKKSDRFYMALESTKKFLEKVY